MSDKLYNTKLLKSRETKNNIYKTLVVSRKDHKKMDLKEIEHMYQAIKERQPHAKMIVRASMPDKYWTLKTLDKSDLDLDQIQEYLNGKVKEVSKFKKAFDVEFSCANPKN